MPIRDQTIQNGGITTENRKKKNLDLEKLEILKLESALDYHLCCKMVNIKNKNIRSIPLKQFFIQVLKKSIAFKAVYSDIQHMTSAKAIVTTVTKELGSLQKLNRDAESKLKDLK